ncbi:MAG: CRISPR-associated CARF protein Csa3 [Candidatus Methanodesulfokora sp.]
MQTALIATLGFEEKFCYRAILRHGLKEGDRIILFTAELVEKVEKAYEWIKRLIQSSYGGAVKVELIQLDPLDPVRSIGSVLKVLDELDNFKIVVNLSGGMRAIVAYVLLACIMRPKKEMKVEIEAEDLSGITMLSSEMLKLIKSGVKEEWLDILKCIAEGANDVKSIAEKLKKDESTIRRQISALEENGLVRIRKRKPLSLELSELAELFLQR